MYRCVVLRSVCPASSSFLLPSSGTGFCGDAQKEFALVASESPVRERIRQIQANNTRHNEEHTQHFQR